MVRVRSSGRRSLNARARWSSRMESAAVSATSAVKMV